MNRSLHWYDHLTINVNFLGISALSQTMTPLVIPLLVQQFVGETQKGSYYGLLRLWSLMVALLIQSLMGMLSDHSKHKWGRRRPFIMFGALGVILVVILIGFTASLEGMPGYWVLFALTILLMVAANTGHGAQQGLIPDIVPENKRGFFSGIKAIFEVPIPVIVVSVTIAKLVSSGRLWAGLLVLCGIMLVTMLITMLVPEKPFRDATSLDWQPFIRLILMTGVFTAVILSVGQFINLTQNISQQMDGKLFVLTSGLCGLAAMTIAVVLGVWLSTRVGIGNSVRENRSFTWWVINRLSFLVGSTGMVSFMVYFLQGRFGFLGEEAAKPAANLTMIVGVFILLSALPSGYLSDRFGRKPLVALSGILAAVGTLLVVLAPSMSLVFVGGILIGIGTGFFYSVNWALGTQVVPREEAGKYLGISNLAGAGAGAISAYIGGPIADAITTLSPQTPGLGYIALFIIYGILFILSIFALRGVVLNDR